MKKSILCTAIGTFISPASDILVTVVGAALSFLVVEFLRSTVDGYKGAKHRKGAGKHG